MDVSYPRGFLVNLSIPTIEKEPFQPIPYENIFTSIFLPV